MILAVLLLKQLLVMLGLSSIGWILTKKKFITAKGNQEMVNLLLYAVIPLTVLHSFFVKNTAERTMQLLYSFVFSLLAFLISMLIAYLVYGTRHKVENFSAAFSNAGFIGIPLVQAALGSEAVFYIASFVAFLNIFQWLYGAYIMSGDKAMISFHAISHNAVIWAFLIGLFCYLAGFSQLPFLKDITSIMAQMNTPLAMVIIGYYMGQISFQAMWKRKSSYLCCLLRLVGIPLVSLFVLAGIPLDCSDVKLAVFLALAAPVGANVAMFAQKFKQDAAYAVEIVILSTMLSLGTLPLLVYVAQLVL